MEAKRYVIAGALALFTVYAPCAAGQAEAGPATEVITNVHHMQNVLIHVYRVDTDGESEPVPEEVSEAVETALPEHVARNASIKELTVLRCRTREQAEVSWSSPAPDGDDTMGPVHQRVSVTVDKSSDTPENVVPLSLSMGIEIPHAEPTGGQPVARRISRQSLGISTSIDVPNGETVLVGKATLTTEDKPSWIFVSAEMID